MDIIYFVYNKMREYQPIPEETASKQEKAVVYTVLEIRKVIRNESEKILFCLYD